jgi:ATP-dependent Clp protease ATP-binding subunit ClpA
MFERYTEKARRAIFFARYAASQYGSPYIESEHLLLGLLREDRAPASYIESIRREIESGITIRERISTSVEVPLRQECKRIKRGVISLANEKMASELSMSLAPRLESAFTWNTAVQIARHLILSPQMGLI